MDLTHFSRARALRPSRQPDGARHHDLRRGRWGADEAGAAAILDAYLERGGNFVDTADIYSGGASETMLGRLVAERGVRDRLVIATKSGFPESGGVPLMGGNGARHIRRALEGSLKRLGTDRIDLYWTHVWDRTTPRRRCCAR